MSLLQRPPLDVDALYYSTPAEPLRYTASKLLDRAESWRPYPGGVVRRAIPNPELRGLQELKGYEHFDAISETSLIEPIDQVMQAQWHADPRSLHIRLGRLSFYRLIDHEGIHPHVDQSIDQTTGIPRTGSLVVLLAINGITEYGLKPDKRNPFDPKYGDLYHSGMKRPQPSTMQYVTLNPGDALLIPTVPPIIHISKMLSPTRLVAAFTARFHPIEPVE